ncbi:MAG: DUF2341 domain-containing protein, partial [Patescibacteria group bacterium]
MRLAKIKNRISFPIIITIFIFIVIIFACVKYVIYLMDKPVELNTNNKIIHQDKIIELTWEDDNTNENLIIRSDQKTYYGFNSAEVYFSVTNESTKDQEVNVCFLFDLPSSQLLEIKKINNDDNEKLKLEEFNEEANLDKLKNSEISRKDNKGLTAGSQAVDIVKANKTNYYKAKIAYAPMSKGEFLIEAFGKNNAYGLLDPFYASDYSYYKTVTINADKVYNTDSDFPILIKTTDSNLKYSTYGGHVASSTGGDIVFTDENDAMLNFEQEKYDPGTGEIIYWVKTDISSTTDTVLKMYYGNASAEYYATTSGVWDDNYVLVQHLNESTGTFFDSTKYNNNGAARGTVSRSVDAQIGKGIYINEASPGEIGVPNSTSLQVTADLTIQGWVKFDSITSGTQTWLFKTANGGNPYSSTACYGFFLSTACDYMRVIKDASNSTQFCTMSPLLSASTWYSRVGTYKSTAMINYVNTVVFNSTTTPVSSIRSADTDLLIGSDTSSWTFGGYLDEIRISNTVRPESWIITEYNNQNDISTFLEFSEENGRKTFVNTNLVDKYTGGLAGYWTFDGPDTLPLNNWGQTNILPINWAVNGCRAEGGMSPNVSGMKLKGIAIYINSAHSAQIRMAVYEGGSLSSPTGATLLKDFGLTTGSGTYQYYIAETTDDIDITANTPLWVVIKGNDGTISTVNSTSAADAGNFQSERGRYDCSGIGSDESVAYPASFT